MLTRGDVTAQIALQPALKFNGGGNINHFGVTFPPMVVENHKSTTPLMPIENSTGTVFQYSGSTGPPASKVSVTRNIPMAGELMEAIKCDFGSFEKMKEKIAAVSVGVQGSGWGWLGFNKESGRLNIAACPNQDPLEGTTGLTPLLGIDVCEHAYYLQYKNVRPDYVKAIWNVVNWENVAERFQAAKK